jgi:molybdopterin synthase sulfur carrier subunit
LTLRVLYFASLRDRTGVGEETVEIATGTDVLALWSMLGDRHPRLSAVSVKPLVACDSTYAGWDRVLDGVAEVAFLPPVSGG